jgi:hypothetical protein
MDRQNPSEMVKSHKHNFSFAPSDVADATIDPRAMMGGHGPHVGRWTLIFKDGRKQSYQFDKVDDMHTALHELSAALGPLLHKNVAWDEAKRQYRKR